MEVILLERVENLGQLGDQVKVKSGYARNYLIPKGKATEATKENVARFEARRAELEKAATESLSEARVRAERMTDLVVTVVANAGNEGRLFGSVGPAEIVDAVTATGNELAKREVRLPEGPLRQIGEYDVPLHLHSDIEVTVRVNVVPA